MAARVIIASLVGAASDAFALWAAWRFFIRPHLVRMMEQVADSRIHLARRLEL